MPLEVVMELLLQSTEFTQSQSSGAQLQLKVKWRKHLAPSVLPDGVY